MSDPSQSSELTLADPRRTPWRIGSSYANGKFYQFDSRQILVMTGWPDPRAWRKTKTIAWKQIRKQADQIMCGWDMTLPERPLVEHFFGRGRVDPAIIRDPVELAANQTLLAQMRSLIGKLEDLFAPECIWPESVSATDRHSYRMAGMELLAQVNYLCQIPQSIRGLLQLFPQGRWQMLNLLARCPGAEDLCASNPALAFALANNWRFHQPAVTQPYRSARSLVHQKQVKIASWLGFPAQKSVVRVLAKIEPACLTASRLHFLKCALQDPETLKLLGHLQTINANVLELVNCRELRPRLSFSLLKEVSEFNPTTSRNSDNSRLLSLMHDTRRMMIRQAVTLNWPPQFRNTKQLQTFHDEAVDALNGDVNAWNKVGLADKPFPSPPYRGLAEIQPIVTAMDLFKEGREMRHCIAVYCGDVLAGTLFAYKVTAPVRATLSVFRNRAGEWVPGEASGYANQTLRTEVRTKLYEDLFTT